MSPLPDAPCACAVCTCAREVGADTSQVQCYLEALESLLDREFDDRGGRYLSASMPLGRDPGRSVHSRRSDTHTDVLTDLNTSRFERVPRFGRVQRAGCVHGVKQQQRSRTGRPRAMNEGRTVRQSDV
jgi:hypothetical protein